MWHVVFAEPGRLPQSRAAKSRDHAIHTACELLSQSFDVRRVLEPNGRSIERAELLRLDKLSYDIHMVAEEMLQRGMIDVEAPGSVRVGSAAH